MTGPLRVAVAGASGFVGSLLVPALVEAGYDVVALTRLPQRYVGAAAAAYADVRAPRSLTRALAGAEVAVYLVHELAAGHSDADLPEREQASARAFGRAAARSGVRQIVYLGGLASRRAARAPELLSPHLRARRLTETALGEAGVPVTVVRAGIVLGAGSLGWELMRQVSGRVPVLAAPWASNARTQPIGARDLIGYLVDVVDNLHGVTLEVGTDEVVTYRDLFGRVARAHGHAGIILPAPALPSMLMEAALRALTDVHVPTALLLLGSMGHDALVNEDRARHLLARRPAGLASAIAEAVTTP